MAYAKIVDSNLNTLAVLNNMISNSLKRRVNGLFTFDFSCYEENLKTEYIQTSNMIDVDGYLFDINYIDIGHTDAIEYDVRTEHVTYRLISEKINNYAKTGTPAEILADILAGTEFSVGTVESTSSIVFAVNRNANKLNIIYSLANTLGLELEYNGFEISMLNSIGQDNGYRVEIRKNLKEIHKIQDKRGVDNLTYKFNVINIFASEELKSNFSDLEKVDIGDTIHLKDSTLGIDTTQSVYEIEKDIIKDVNINIVTGNNFDNITDDMAFLQETAIKQTDIIYGVKINNAVGIGIERTDLKARSIFNADEFRMQVGDGTGNYVDAIYFDAINGKYVFVGELNATDFVGGTIDIGNGTFTVDNNGNMIANNATIIGVINGSTINGGTVNGSTIIGGIFKTNSTGERIEISGNELTTYNNSNQKDGVAITDPSNLNKSMMKFYNAGTETLQFFNNGSVGYSLNPLNGAELHLGANGSITRLYGDVFFESDARIKLRHGTLSSKPSNLQDYELWFDTANRILITHVAGHGYDAFGSQVY